MKFWKWLMKEIRADVFTQGYAEGYRAGFKSAVDRQNEDREYIKKMFGESQRGNDRRQTGKGLPKPRRNNKRRGTTA